MTGAWEELQRPPRSSVTIAGTEVVRGSRVVLAPRGGDILTRAVAGKAATVESIEEEIDGGLHLVVTVDDDPGRDLARAGHPARRFFFAPEDVLPLRERTARVLVAGIGNTFMADD